MNEKDKNEMLEGSLNENEAYQCKLWAVSYTHLLWKPDAFCIFWRWKKRMYLKQ